MPSSPEKKGGPAGSDGGQARHILRAFALAGQLGFTLAGGGILGAFVGHALDRWLGTRPALLIAGLLLGFAGGAAGAYRAVRGFLRE